MLPRSQQRRSALTSHDGCTVAPAADHGPNTAHVQEAACRPHSGRCSASWGQVRYADRMPAPPCGAVVTEAAPCFQAAAPWCTRVALLRCLCARVAARWSCCATAEALSVPPCSTACRSSPYTTSATLSCSPLAPSVPPRPYQTCIGSLSDVIVLARSPALVAPIPAARWQPALAAPQLQHPAIRTGHRSQACHCCSQLQPCIPAAACATAETHAATAAASTEQYDCAATAQALCGITS